MQYVQSSWGLRTSSMLRAGYPTLLAWRGRYELSRLKTSRCFQCSPRMITECLFTRSMLIKMYKFTISWLFLYLYIVFTFGQFHAVVHSVYLVFQIAVLAVLLWLFDVLHTSIVHDFWCPRQTQHLRFETSFRPEHHTDWEKAPPSYDLQSWGNLCLKAHLRILYPHAPR